MTGSLFWIQCGCCSGDTVSLLNAEAPDFQEALAGMDIELLWHPSLSANPAADVLRLHRGVTEGDIAATILVVEGAVLRGPGGTGMFDAMLGVPKKDYVYRLAEKADYVIAAGTCASFGGIPAEGPTEATGLQFHRTTRGGFLGAGFRSRAGLPVINLAGCPAHGEVMLGVLASIRSGADLALDEYQRPKDWYGTLVHQGCTRNEYHEYRVEETDFGEKGCLFFHMGCRGPLTHGPCNRLLWNRRNSKTRAGIPCHGCTSPDFPSKYPFFETRNIEGIPLDLPNGVKRAHYMVYKGMAAVATPKRLQDRETDV